jgi:hypothetical protein
MGLEKKSSRYILHSKSLLKYCLNFSHQAAKATIEALGSDIPKPEFIDLLAGWETFTKTGVALPQETIE